VAKDSQCANVAEMQRMLRKARVTLNFDLSRTIRGRQELALALNAVF